KSRAAKTKRLKKPKPGDIELDSLRCSDLSAYWRGGASEAEGGSTCLFEAVAHRPTAKLVPPYFRNST
ncbi:MAG TPA: hypothetical protein VGQ35_04850, partial [Dongiaceae bacterium]|nr:hypothetical protein [Dongiaceae bacterium]